MAARLLTYEDVSERWQVPLTTLRVWVMEGKLKPIKLGRLVRFLESYVAQIETTGLVMR
jgi:excisionase family DNA binding protein